MPKTVSFHSSCLIVSQQNGAACMFRVQMIRMLDRLQRTVAGFESFIIHTLHPKAYACIEQKPPRICGIMFKIHTKDQLS